MGNLSAARIVIIVALGALSTLLLIVFFVVYFAGNQPRPVELTSQPPVAASQEPLPTPSNESGNPTLTSVGGAGPDTREPAADLRVYVAGAVMRPDVYALRPGDRVVDALRAAGGPGEQADLEAVNLAVRVQDEGYYYIPTRGTIAQGGMEKASQQSVSAPAGFPPAAADPATGKLALNGEDPPADSAPSALVNLNTASQAELESLPSIGPARAGAIIAYRDQHGPFASVEEITAVSGIGQGILENLQHLVTVGP